MLSRWTASSRAPLIALAIVSLISLAARSYKLDEPCQRPCNTANDHTLIFDEAYYVNAARVIAHIRPPSGSHYDESPLGSDPNAEHPQGAKLIMAAAIEIFGDGPFAWRIGSLIFGSIAILAMYGLVRWSGGGRWSAVGAATLMAADNLMLVHGRIATLDIYGVALMVWGVGLYMRGSPWWAALVLALADCMKEVAPYALLIIALLEVGRLTVGATVEDRPPGWALRPTLERLAITIGGSLLLWIAGLQIMGWIATPYADSQHWLITGGALDHLWHIIKYAEALKVKGDPGIASYPWMWLLDLKPITYARVEHYLPGQGQFAVVPVVSFLGMISPPIIYLAVPAMAFGAGRVFGLWRAARRHMSWSPQEVQIALLGIAWFVGTWVPYELQSAFDQRISYIYYMVYVMPGIYLSITYMISIGWRQRLLWLRGLIGGWGVLVLAAAVLMYPFVAIF